MEVIGDIEAKFGVVFLDQEVANGPGSTVLALFSYVSLKVRFHRVICKDVWVNTFTASKSKAMCWPINETVASASTERLLFVP
jgi:hypothetical protein